jgi:hypothetical protein
MKGQHSLAVPLARISQTGWGFEGNRGSYTLKLLQ